MSDKVRWFTPIKNVEQEAINQVYRTASMPFVQGVAVMPDVHFGKGSTVGTVVATRGAVMPACVGVDIGCGMIAVRTKLKPESVRPKLEEIRKGIERRIPVGVGGFGTNSSMVPSASERVGELMRLSDTLFGSKLHMDQRSNHWQKQLGSLGGGNHFIEICIGWPFPEGTIPINERAHLIDDESVWVLLHSGSRGVGNKTGNYWTNVAKKLPKHYMNGVDLPDADLAALIEGTPEFDQYLKELHWCQEFARLNREEMMDRVLWELSYTLGQGCTLDGCGTVFPLSYDIKDLEVSRVNCHHNFVEPEMYDGEMLLITRKGAIRATREDQGLIPGSMGTSSYIVKGLGNVDAYNSAPHGAGRRMSRTQARKQFTIEDLAESMSGIEARLRPEILDEHPGAYKDIDRVINEASVLVTPTHQLTQLISVKGD